MWQPEGAWRIHGPEQRYSSWTCITGGKCSAPFLRALWLVCASKVYSGLGADIVMESLHSQRFSSSPATRPAKRGRFILRSHSGIERLLLRSHDQQPEHGGDLGHEDWLEVTKQGIGMG